MQFNLANSINSICLCNLNLHPLIQTNRVLSLFSVRKKRNENRTNYSVIIVTIDDERWIRVYWKWKWKLLRCVFLWNINNKFWWNSKFWKWTSHRWTVFDSTFSKRRHFYFIFILFLLFVLFRSIVFFVRRKKLK